MIGSLKEIDEDSFSTRLPADLVSDNARAAGSSSSVDWQMQQTLLCLQLTVTGHRSEKQMHIDYHELHAYYVCTLDVPRLRDVKWSTADPNIRSQASRAMFKYHRTCVALCRKAEKGSEKCGGGVPKVC